VSERFEIVFATEGQSDAVRAFEDLKIKELEAKNETGHLARELRKLQQSGTASAEQIDNVSRSLVRSQEASRRLGQEAANLSTQSIAAGDKLERMGSVASAVGTVIGRLNPAWARFGASIGTIGSQLPALTGSLGPVSQIIAAVTVAVDLGAQAWDVWTDATTRAGNEADNTKRQVTDLANSLTQLRTRQRALAGAGTVEQLETVFEDADERAMSLREVLDRQRAEAESQRIDAARQIGVLRARMQEAIDANPANAGLIRTAGREAQEIERLTDTVRTVNNRVRQLAEETARQVVVADRAEDALNRARDRPVGLPELDAPDSGRRGGAQAAAQSRAQMAAQARAEATAAALQLKVLDQQNEARARRNALEDTYQRELQEQIQFAATAGEAERAQIDATALARLAAFEKEREQLAISVELRATRAEAAREEAQKTAQFTMGLIGGVSSTFEGFFRQTIDFLREGGDLADEAYKAQLKSFLESTAIEYSIRALAEVGQAIASFASQDYSSGAQHIAAAAVYGAVAVATGVGSAAISVPAGASAEAGPEQVQSAAPAGGGGGQNNTIYINAPQAIWTEAERGQVVSNGLRALRRERGTGSSRI